MFSTVVLALLTLGPPTPREQALLDDAKDGVLDRVSFVDAALIASGVPDDQLAQARASLSEIIEPVRAAALGTQDPERRAKRLLEALHDSAFRQYRLEATTLPDLWRTGEFNCLSSSVVYVIAADGVLESARAVLSVRHALVQVVVNGRAHDVQTTVRSGFGMARKQMLSAEYLSRVARPGEDLAKVEKEIVDAEEVPVLSLIAGLYANRAVLLMNQGGDSSEADALFDRASRLAIGKSKARFGVWRAALVNDNALALAKSGRFDEAVHLLERAVETAGEHRAVLTRNIGVFRLSLAREAAGRGDWVQALAHAEAAKNAGVTEAASLTGEAKGKLAVQRGACDGGAQKERLACLVTFSGERLKAGDRSGALTAARQAQALAPRDPAALAAIYDVEVQRLRQLADAGDDCDEAATLASSLEQLANGFSSENWSGTPFVVNCFTVRAERHFEKREYDFAASAYRRALAFEPRNDALLQNVEAAEFNTAASLSRDGRCDEARAVLGRGVPKDRWGRVLEPCWVNVTAKLGAAKAWPQLVTQARHGLLDVPGSEALTHNLEAAIQSLAVEAANAGRCDEAKVLLPDVQRSNEELAHKIVQRCR